MTPLWFLSMIQYQQRNFVYTGRTVKLCRVGLSIDATIQCSFHANWSRENRICRSCIVNYHTVIIVCLFNMVEIKSAIFVGILPLLTFLCILTKIRNSSRCRCLLYTCCFVNKIKCRKPECRMTDSHF